MPDAPPVIVSHEAPLVVDQPHPEAAVIDVDPVPPPAGSAAAVVVSAYTQRRAAGRRHHVMSGAFKVGCSLSRLETGGLSAYR